jgi:hypothetical protein
MTEPMTEPTEHIHIPKYIKQSLATVRDFFTYLNDKNTITHINAYSDLILYILNGIGPKLVAQTILELSDNVYVKIGKHNHPIERIRVVDDNVLLFLDDAELKDSTNFITESDIKDDTVDFETHQLQLRFNYLFDQDPMRFDGYLEKAIRNTLDNSTLIVDSTADSTANPPANSTITDNIKSLISPNNQKRILIFNYLLKHNLQVLQDLL